MDAAKFLTFKIGTTHSNSFTRPPLRAPGSVSLFFDCGPTQGFFYCGGVGGASAGVEPSVPPGFVAGFLPAPVPSCAVATEPAACSRVRNGKNGNSSKGSYSRADSAATGLALSNVTWLLHGSS